MFIEPIDQWGLSVWQYLDPDARQYNLRCKWCLEKMRSNDLADMVHCSLCPRLSRVDWEQQSDGWLIHRVWQTRVMFELEMTSFLEEGKLDTDLAWLYDHGYQVVIDVHPRSNGHIYPQFIVSHPDEQTLYVNNPAYMRSNIEQRMQDRARSQQ